jgi:hypothetical protein
MSTSWWEERTAEVSQAVGMVSAQADCTVNVALLLLKDRSQATGRDIETVADAVVSRQERFTCDSPGDLFNGRPARPTAQP